MFKNLESFNKMINSNDKLWENKIQTVKNTLEKSGLEDPKSPCLVIRRTSDSSTGSPSKT